MGLNLGVFSQDLTKDFSRERKAKQERGRAGVRGVHGRDSEV